MLLIGQLLPFFFLNIHGGRRFPPPHNLRAPKLIKRNKNTSRFLYGKQTETVDSGYSTRRFRRPLNSLKGIRAVRRVLAFARTAKSNDKLKRKKIQTISSGVGWKKWSDDIGCTYPGFSLPLGHRKPSRIASSAVGVFHRNCQGKPSENWKNVLKLLDRRLFWGTAGTVRSVFTNR